ncbi:MAG: phosphotransferase [Marmoricola sp.]
MTRPGSRTDLEQVPHGRTAQRLTWQFLPRDLRGLIEDRLGSAVAHAESRTSGFTPGFASVLTGEDGATLFVKAASMKAQADFARAYLAEADKLAVMPVGLPAPELLWVHQDEGWVALGFEAVDGRPPKRPWRPAELERALDLAEAIAAATDPVPAELSLARVVEDIPALVTAWERVDASWPHRAEAATLASAYADLPDRAFCHTDLRDDNVLLLGDGNALACDWNWPALGPRWQDTVDLLVSAYGDGVDVESILASRALTRDVDPEHVDAWLAAQCGFMLEASGRPVPPTSPYLRVHSRWYAEALWGWLCQRRGWA